MGSYTHLDLDERRELYQLTSAGRSPRQAAAELWRHPATIYRELKRNHRFDEEPMFRGYIPLTAHSMAAERRLKGAKISRYPELARYVVDRLEAAWSPEQIAGYLRHRTAGPLRVSHETIYQLVYGCDGQAAKLARLLPTGRRKRRRRYARKPRGLNIPPGHTIAARPPVIAERADFGHWEGDLIAFKVHHGKAILTSLVERRSRFTVLTPNSSRHSAGIMDGIERHLGTLPPSLRRTITLDRGTEFAGYGRLRESPGHDRVLCQP